MCAAVVITLQENFKAQLASQVARQFVSVIVFGRRAIKIYNGLSPSLAVMTAVECWKEEEGRLGMRRRSVVGAYFDSVRTLNPPRLHAS